MQEYTFHSHFSPILWTAGFSYANERGTLSQETSETNYCRVLFSIPQYFRVVVYCIKDLEKTQSYTLYVKVSHSTCKGLFLSGVTTLRWRGSNIQWKSYLQAYQGKQHPDHCCQKFQQYPHHCLLHLSLKVIHQEANLLQGQLCLELELRMLTMDQLVRSMKLHIKHQNTTSIN